MPGPASQPPPDRDATRRRRRADGLLTIGLLLVAAAAYTLTSPGRIDIIDGQWRYEAARNLLLEGRPVVRDPVLARHALIGAEGRRYTSYGAGGSVAGLPLIALGRALGEDPAGELGRFLFSLTSPLFGAALVALLFGFYRDLGVAPRAAAGWSLATGFATLIWPLATSSFDQVQHAFLITAALRLAHAAARRRSTRLAFAAGAVGGLLLLYQEVYGVLLPAVGVALLAEPGTGDRGGSRRRLVALVVGAWIGVALFLLYNQIRFDSVLSSGKLLLANAHPPAWGLPPVGLWGLFASPGKSVLLYSPPIVLALAGLPGLLAVRTRLAQAIGALLLSHCALISSLSFWHGDWTWGPRYLVVVLAPLALAMPFMPRGRRAGRLVAATVGLGIVVQLLALSLDHQRFFFERRLMPFFWYRNPTFYLRESQLVARPGEIWRSLGHGAPLDAERFQPSPYPLLTYTIFGSVEALEDDRWVDRFPVFHLPRPWPLWMPRVARLPPPVPVAATAAGLLAVGGLGLLLLGGGLRAAGRSP